MREIRNTSVAVIGGAGFLGSHLVNHLIRDRNCIVLVIDNLVAGKREYVNPSAYFLHADITKSEAFLLNRFKQFDIEYVFNYAAWPYIPDSFARPLHVFDVNATGAIQVINAAQEAGVQGILQVSSAEIYGNYETNGQADGRNKIDEEGEVHPHSTYGVAKAAVDYYCQTAFRERSTPVIALRQFNCVGERETHPYIVPEIISQIHRENNVWERERDHSHRNVFLGNNSFRDFQYAGDAVRMATELLEKGSFGEVYNMGSEDGIQMYDLAKLIGEVMDVEVRVERDERRVRPWEIWHLQSDNTKLYSTISTRPTISLREALSRTVDYYRANNYQWSWER